MSLTPNAIQTLEQTSRTFFLPIMRLPEGLQDAVGSAYLCMRAIDEIEDHAALPAAMKQSLLLGIQEGLAGADGKLRATSFDALFLDHRDALPDVTLGLGEFMLMAPTSVAKLVRATTAEMAGRMAHWVGCNWRVATEEDLDAYTYDVAGAVGLLLTELWDFYDDLATNRELAVGFGRGLQAVNILRNQHEDQGRGIDFFPDGWGRSEMVDYARKQLAWGAAYIAELAPGPVHDFCAIPHALAEATLEVLVAGGEKLTREQVVKVIGTMKDGG